MMPKVRLTKEVTAFTPDYIETKYKPTEDYPWWFVGFSGFRHSGILGKAGVIVFVPTEVLQFEDHP